MPEETPANSAERAVLNIIKSEAGRKKHQKDCL
jgi:hypothetical protein